MAAPSSSGSDRDEAFDEDMEALRRACMLTGTNPSNFHYSDSDSDEESSGRDEIDLLHRIQERFGLPASAVDPFPIIEPLSTKLPSEPDEEDDFETLRAIQRRFAKYENDSLENKLEKTLQEPDIIDSDVMCAPATPNIFSNNDQSMALSEDQDSSYAESHGIEEEACHLNARDLMSSKFPEAAQNFVDALKKNRSCQKFIRRKLIEIEAKIEKNRELKERIKCLMDFQVGCKRKVGQILNQKKDPRIRLISLEKPRSEKASKTSWRKVPALCFGPKENSYVSKYRMVLEEFPFSLTKQHWSTKEKENLLKGIKQQYQEMLILNSMNFENDADSITDLNLLSSLSTIHLEITPEIIRSFMPLVNWDRLASMYLPGRSGAECEARWLNCEDPMINHNPWTVVEDKKLLFIVQERGVYNWIDISVVLGTNRTPFQCLARYQRSLNPHILNKEWTEDEDVKLRAAVESYGDENWQIIASCLEGRTGTQCSNRWRYSLNPERKKVGRWSVDEDKRLKVAVMLFGAKNWNKISQFAPGRTQVQCRERWLNCLNPSLNLRPWTAEEDAKLLDAIAYHGYCWSKIATCVPPRTDSQCRRRWKILLPGEVPLLQAAAQLKKTVLVSNFVDRKTERPAIGPNDFIQVATCPAIDEGGDVAKTKKKKKLSDNQLKGSRIKSRVSIEENLLEDDVLHSPADIVPDDLPLKLYVNSCSADGRSFKTKRNVARDKTVKKSTVQCRSPSVGTVAAEAMPNSSLENGHTNSCNVEKTKRRTKKTRLKSMDDNQTFTSLGLVNAASEIVPADAPLVFTANPSIASDKSFKTTSKRTTSDGAEPMQSNKSNGRSKNSRKSDIRETIERCPAERNVDDHPQISEEEFPAVGCHQPAEINVTENAAPTCKVEPTRGSVPNSRRETKIHCKETSRVVDDDDDDDSSLAAFFKKAIRKRKCRK